MIRKMICKHASREPKKDINLKDVSMAMRNRWNPSHAQPPPRDKLIELSTYLNRAAIGPVVPSWPNEALTQANVQLDTTRIRQKLELQQLQQQQLLLLEQQNQAKKKKDQSTPSVSIIVDNHNASSSGLKPEMSLENAGSPAFSIPSDPLKSTDQSQQTQSITNIPVLHRSLESTEDMPAVFRVEKGSKAILINMSPSHNQQQQNSGTNNMEEQ